MRRLIALALVAVAAGCTPYAPQIREGMSTDQALKEMQKGNPFWTLTSVHANPAAGTMDEVWDQSGTAFYSSHKLTYIHYRNGYVDSVEYGGY